MQERLLVYIVIFSISAADRRLWSRECKKRAFLQYAYSPPPHPPFWSPLLFFKRYLTDVRLSDEGGTVKISCPKIHTVEQRWPTWLVVLGGQCTTALKPSHIIRPCFLNQDRDGLRCRGIPTMDLYTNQAARRFHTTSTGPSLRAWFQILALTTKMDVE